MKSIISWSFSVIIGLCCQSLSGEELIVNGSFAKGDSGWEYLTLGGTASATDSVENGVYALRIKQSSCEAWHVQLRQRGIKLVHGEPYRFSFDAYAGAKREIEASVGMENGPFTLYSYPLAAKIKLTTDKQSFSTHFTMIAPDDNNARVQFNCGLSTGDVFLDNVSIERMTAPAIILLAPNGGEEWSSGSVKEIRWVGVKMQKVALSYSMDAGKTWNCIAASADNSGIFPWTVPALVSAWCQVRAADVNGGQEARSRKTFEIGNFFNLVRNGTFSESSNSAWNPLGVYGSARAKGIFSGGEYVIDVDTAGTAAWNVQFTQTGIPLVQNEEYQFSFEAYADVPRPLMANIGQSGQGYQTYLHDTADGTVNLTTSRQTYKIEFKMEKASDLDARLEFNAGHAAGAVHIDNVSLYNKNQPPLPVRPLASVRVASGRVPFVVKGAGFSRSYSVALRGPVRYAAIFDLRGKLVRALETGVECLEWDRGSDRAVFGSGAFILLIRGDACPVAIPIVIPGG